MKRHLMLAGIGLIVGLVVGLGYTWLISPVKYVNTAPASLRADYKTQYIQLVAGAFAIDGDVTRAQTRLALLGEANVNQTVTALAQQMAASESNSAMVHSLTALAQALNMEPTPAPSPTDLELTVTPVPSATPLASATPYLLPTHAPTATPLGEFGFVGKELVCDANLQPPLIQVIMLNASEEQIPGVEVVVDWDGGFDHFFTGLKPELGRGYGDFAMTEGVEYAVHLAASPSAAVTDLAIETCPNLGGTPFPGSWLLTFRQP